MTHRILVSNLGYARDIDGSLFNHFTRSWRNVITPLSIQKHSLDSYKRIVTEHSPDICCMLEIDTGSFDSCGFNQFDYVVNTEYPNCEVSSKYAENSRLTWFPFTRGKCNGFMAKQPYSFQRLYLASGSKRLVYRIELAQDLVLYLTHLALGPKTRTQQLKELRAMADKEAAYVLIAGDFNIHAGLSELEIFTKDDAYTLMNDSSMSTFTMFGRHYLLDLCIASTGIKDAIQLQIIDQPFSDHDALLIDVNVHQ